MKPLKNSDLNNFCLH